MGKELTQKESEKLLLDGINYLIENKDDAKICEKDLMKVFQVGIRKNITRLYQEELSYRYYYFLYYLKTLGDTSYYYEMFESAFDSVKFERDMFFTLKEKLKAIKENKDYERLIPFFEVIKELLILDKNREENIVKDIKILCQTLEGHIYSFEYPNRLTNKEMENKVLEKVKMLSNREE